MRKIILVLLMVSIAGFIFAAGSKESSAEGAEAAVKMEQVELVTYMFGEPPVGYEEVYEVVNEILTEKHNATLKLNFLSWGDWSKKYPLILTSGEEFDLTYAASWAYFGDLAQKGVFTALNDVLPKAAPDLYNNLPKAAVKQATVNGKMYMVPSTNASPQQNGFFVRGDLMDKYGMTALETLEDFGEYLQNVLDNEEGIVPYHVGINDIGNFASALANSEDWSFAGFSGTGVFSYFDTNFENVEEDVFCWYLTPEFESFARMAKEWADRGYWTKNALTNKTRSNESMVYGKSASTITGIDDANNKYKQIVAEHPEWDPRWYPIAPNTAYEMGAYKGNGFAVPASSKNPERALKVLEELTLNRDLYDLCFYGIEGKHFTLTEQGRIKPGPAGQYSGEDISVWGFRNVDYIRYPTDLMPGYVEMLNKIREKAISNELSAFTFDNSNIKSEIAAIQDVEDQYGDPLILGMVGVEEGLKTLEEKLKQAGIEKVLSEARKQCREFVE
jgi:putative aldouronate transport system substrate-binding protein